MALVAEISLVTGKHGGQPVIVGSLGLSGQPASCELGYRRRRIGARPLAVIDNELALIVPSYHFRETAGMSPVAGEAEDLGRAA